MNAKTMVLTILNQVDYFQLVPDLIDEQFFWGPLYFGLDWTLPAIYSVL